MLRGCAKEARMISIKSVLVPVDFSDPSREAVQCALSVARQFGAKVTIAHIVADPATLTPNLPTESHALASGLYEAASKDILKLIPPGDNSADKG
jgi:nucleotide-binding universal stress UspA family protein